jgi:hypothetical protein
MVPDIDRLLAPVYILRTESHATLAASDISPNPVSFFFIVRAVLDLVLWESVVGGQLMNYDNHLANQARSLPVF